MGRKQKKIEIHLLKNIIITTKVVLKSLSQVLNEHNIIIKAELLYERYCYPNGYGPLGLLFSSIHLIVKCIDR
jgi:hypothetical protein